MWAMGPITPATPGRILEMEASAQALCFFDGNSFWACRVFGKGAKLANRFCPPLALLSTVGRRVVPHTDPLHGGILAFSG
jgi:hypothetical protein